jgi:hypothetical protein
VFVGNDLPHARLSMGDQGCALLNRIPRVVIAFSEASIGPEHFD